MQKKVEIFAPRRQRIACRNRPASRNVWPYTKRATTGRSLAFPESLGLPSDMDSFSEFLRELLLIITRECGGVWATFWSGEDREVTSLEYQSADPFVMSALAKFVSFQATAKKQVFQLCDSLLRDQRETTVLHAGDELIPHAARDLFEKTGVLTVVISPVSVGNRLLGWITLQSPLSPENVSADQVAYVEACANQAAVALHLAETTPTPLRKMDEARAIAETLGEPIAPWDSSAGVEAVTLGIMLSAAKLLGARANSLWLGDRQSARILPLWIRDERSPSDFPLQTLMSEDISPYLAGPIQALLHKWSAATQMMVEPIAKKRIRGFAEMAGYVQADTKSGSLIVLPLLFQKAPLGFAIFFTDSPPLLSDGSLLAARTLAFQAAHALKLDVVASARVEKAVAEERAKIARDLHDILAQSFSGILLQIDAMQPHEIDSASGISDRLEKIGIQAIRGLDEVRRTLITFRPALPIGQTLVERLAALVKESTGSNPVAVDLIDQSGNAPLDAAASAHLYAIAAEAVHNALRHSHAMRITVSLSARKQHIELRIADNGRGIPQKDAWRFDGAHHGIANMRARTRQISAITATNARFTLRSKPGKGTEVKVAVPISADRKSLPLGTQSASSV